ncbi:hypothetical protein BD410DRAFT_645667 [Rickenella mellea]|uniref:Uncharacterized protein n=1 Tax=Rickenella mellea TaxID=50990 RepID=A0A4Y7PNI1_9AGAM|nr:hypothetical protein BD410DRAFT_645667 [Rickenella mellea]
MVATQILWNENGEISGLGRLERLLSRLKKYGFRNARSDEVWDDVPVEAVEWSIPSYSPSITQDDLPRLRRSLNEAKLCMAVLDKVRDYLGRRIRFVRKACMSLVLENGINTMPDEILSLIFEACHRMTDGWTFARCVRQVSWRFRQVSYQTPLLWTRFSPDLSDSQVQAFIARSGGMDLEVSTDWSIPEVEDKLLHTLCPHSKRWSSLKLESPSTASVMNMLDMWELPSLSRIRVHNPQYRLGFSFQSQLTSVTLSLFEQDVDFRLLAHTLRGMTSMRHLFLTLDECREVQKFGIRMDVTRGISIR